MAQSSSTEQSSRPRTTLAGFGPLSERAQADAAHLDQFSRSARRRQLLSSAAFQTQSAGSLAVRGQLGLDRLPRALAASVREAIEKHAERALNRPDRTAEAPGRIATLYADRVGNDVSRIVLANYRQATARWAGGNTDVVVSTGSPHAYGHSYREWSTNGKWSGLSVRYHVTVSPTWRSSVQRAGLADAGGMLTTHAEPLAGGAGAFIACWVVQTRGLDIRAESGVILRLDDGSYIHAASLAAARRLADRRQPEVRQRLTRAAGARAEARRRRFDALVAMSASQLIEQYGKVTITVRDSDRAGNCPTGTESWLNSHAPGRESGTVAEVLEIDDGTYARRACVAAILRSGVTR